MYTYRGKLDRCVDGDTVDLWVDLGFRVHTHQRFRLEHVNTPERGKKGFDEATELLERLITENLDGEGYFWFESIKTGKYGRWILNSQPITSVLALNYPYDKDFKNVMKRLRESIKNGENLDTSHYINSPEWGFCFDILDDINTYGLDYFRERIIV
jgi:micrococcal nuclease